MDVARHRQTYSISTPVFRNRFLADFFNAFNNLLFANPTLDLNASNTFGVLTQQFIAPERNNTAGSRWIQLGFRIEF